MDARLLCLLLTLSVAKEVSGTDTAAALYPAQDCHQLLHSCTKSSVRCDTFSPDRVYHCGYLNMCTCWGNTANCSRNYGNLTFIPELPEGIECLYFAHNKISEIHDETFFANATNIAWLDLGANNLTRIENGTFRLMKNLKLLKLDHNRFNTAEDFAGALVQTLEFLQIIHVDLWQMEKDIFVRYPLPNLSVLYMHDNEQHIVEMEMFEHLTELYDLGIADNHIYEFRVANRQLSVDRMVIETNILTHFPETCIANTNESIYPELQRLNLAYNFIYVINKPVCLPKLEVLNLTGNAFCKFQEYMFHFSRFPVLKILSLNSLRVIREECGKKLSNYTFSNPSLQFLDFRYDFIDFDNQADVNTRSFANCTDVQTLLLSHNYLVKPNHFADVFGDMASLGKVDLSGNELQQIDIDTFAEFPKLQWVALHRNKLTNLPDGVFDGLKNLTYLDISNNMISVIRETTFSSDTLKRLERLDLGSSEGFDCSCDLQWFKRFLASHPTKMRSDFPYSCANIRGTNVTSFYLNEQQCMLSHDAAALTFVTSGILIIALALFALFYHYRWHIRLVMYDAFRSRNATTRWRRLQQQHFDYDVFVSYASEDLKWVQTYLVPELEGRLGLRLCIHQRNFIPGKPIVDNIAESVESSKKVLMVFSINFARSLWCQFELTFCLSHVLDNDDVLVVVLLHDIPSRDLTSAMMAVYKTTTCLQWENDVDGIWSFWGRLHVALKEVISRNRRVPLEC